MNKIICLVQILVLVYTQITGESVPTNNNQYEVPTFNGKHHLKNRQDRVRTWGVRVKSKIEYLKIGNNNLGSAMSAVGDVNNDGFPDILVGASGFSGNLGGAYLFYGGNSVSSIIDPDFLLKSDGLTFNTTTCSNVYNYCYLGSAVSNAGDINGDGIPDILIGEFGYSSNNGRVFLIYGRPDMSNMKLDSVAPARGVSLSATTGVGWLGSPNAVGVADFNGDGINDILMGAPQFQSALGRAYVVYGSRTMNNAIVNTMDASTGFYILYGTTCTGCTFGSVVGRVGDTNGDGKEEIAVGSNFNNRGRLYILFGSNSITNSIDLNTLTSQTGYFIGITSTTACGSCGIGLSFSYIGDMNGDGKADILFGASGWSNGGRVFLVWGGGNTNIDLLSAAFTPSQGIYMGFLTGTCTACKIGVSVSSADVNGDGIADIIIGASGYSTNQGMVYIVYGNRNLTNIDLNALTTSQGIKIGYFTGACFACYLGGKVSAAGDLDQDGYDDVLIAAPQARSLSGTVYIIYGGSGLLDMNLNLTMTASPTISPSRTPTRNPTSNRPSWSPSLVPTRLPTCSPTKNPTLSPSIVPTKTPTVKPSTAVPTSRIPTTSPSTTAPSKSPTFYPSYSPSYDPSFGPSAQPSSQPSNVPSSQPSYQKTSDPTVYPSSQPTSQPTNKPSCQPSSQPSCYPTSLPTSQPSSQPSSLPTFQSTNEPSYSPSYSPSTLPSTSPSTTPSYSPSSPPSTPPITCLPSSKPSTMPSPQPTLCPSNSPSVQSSDKPSQQPSSLPTFQSLTQPSSQPTYNTQLSNKPSTSPSTQSTRQPSSRTSSCRPSFGPSHEPSSRPSCRPSYHVTKQPSAGPSVYASIQPSSLSPTTNDPTMKPSSLPTSSQPSSRPSLQPILPTSIAPSSSQPSFQPSRLPTFQSTNEPSYSPSTSPSSIAPSSSQPTISKSNMPSVGLTVNPTIPISASPTLIPSMIRTVTPTYYPSLPLTIVPSLIPSYRTALPTTVQSTKTVARILKRTFASTSTSLSIQVRLDRDGIVYAAIFPIRNNDPSSIQEILIQNYGSQSHQNVSTVVTIDGLTAVTDYKVFLLTESSFGYRMSYEDMISTKQVVSTTCCRKVTAKFSAVVFQEFENNINVLTLSIDGSPTKGLGVSLELYKWNNTLNAPVPNKISSTTTWQPAQAMFQSGFSTSSQQVKLSLSKLTAGTYGTRLRLLGTNARNYTISYSGVPDKNLWQDGSMVILNVFNVNRPLPAPKLQQAIFSVDGSYLFIQFDSATNQGGLSQSFACQELLQFSCAKESRCIWQQDYTSVKAYVKTQEECAGPGDGIQLSSYVVLKAKCPVVNGGCASFATWPVSDTTVRISIQSPVTPIAPVVLLSMPTTLGTCSSLLLDTTASRGSGGRPWSQYNITVRAVSTMSGESTNTTLLGQLQSFFVSSSYSLQTPSPVLPFQFLLPNTRYSFQVRLCNFLGRCGEATKSVTIIDTRVPILSIAGSSIISLKRSQTLNIQAKASLTKCNGERMSSNVTYSWLIFEGGNVLKQIVSVAKDKSRYILPSYSLVATKVYEVKVSATYLTSSTMISVQVSVEQGNLFAVVKGGLEQTVRVGSTLTLDASNSYDEDVPNVSGVLAGLLFSWSCVQIQPNFNATCFSIFEKNSFVGNRNKPLLPLVTASKLTGTVVAQLQLVIQDTSNSRSVATTVSVKLLPALAATIALNSNSKLNKINPSTSLVLAGMINMPQGSTGANITWTTSESGLVLSDVALSPLRKILTLREKASNQTYLEYLILPANVLQGGFQYSFTLMCALSSPGITTAVNILITVNTAPLPGSFLLSPSQGIEIVQSFVWTCLQWQDDDLPITYQFSYFTSTDTKIVLRSLSQTPYTSTSLPAGTERMTYNVTCIADIYDNLMANTTAVHIVKVTPTIIGNESNSNAMLTRLVSSLTTLFPEVDDIKQAAALSTHILNRVNCSLSPNCSALNRLECSRRDHTCGRCLSDNFVGFPSDSNTICYKANQLPKGNAATFHTLIQCGMNCSSHGHCIYKSYTTGSIVTSCFVGDISCYAMCSCEQGYQHSAYCDIPDSEVASKILFRENIISGLGRLLELEETNSQSIEGLLNHLSDVTESPYELSTKAANSVLQTTKSILHAAVSSDVNVNEIGDFLAPIDAIVLATTNQQLYSKSATTLLTGAAQSVVVAQEDSGLLVQELLTNYSKIIAASMLPGQAAKQIRKQSMRSTIGAHDPSYCNEGETFNVTVSLPQSANEIANNMNATHFHTPLACVNNNNGNENPMQISVSSVDASLFSTISYEANPVTVHFSSSPCSRNTANCTTMITMKRSTSSQTTDVLSMKEKKHVPMVNDVSTLCKFKDYSIHSYECPNSKTYQVSCRGKRETFVSQCPIEYEEPSCQLLTSSHHSSYDTCEMISYTEEVVHCKCSFTSNGHRNLQAINITDNSITINYVGLLQSLETEFTSTVMSAGSLNASTIAKGWQVMVTIGIFVGVILIAMIYSHLADAEDRKVAAEDMNTKESVWKRVSKYVNKESENEALTAKPRMIWKKNQDTDNNHMMKLAEQSLPQILRSQSIWLKVKAEMKRHHRWFGVMFYYSERFPRLLRVVSLATNIIVMLFIQSLTYNLTNGDDGSCEMLDTKQSCLQPVSAFGTGSSKCYWTTKTHIVGQEEDGSCAYVQPDNDLMVVLFVAIFSSLVSTPVAMFAEWILQHVLAAPTQTFRVPKTMMNKVAPMPPEAFPVTRKHHLSSVVAPTTSSSGTTVPTTNESHHTTLAQRDLQLLTLQLTQYRNTMTNPTEKKELDELWGLNEEGNFHSLQRLHAKQHWYTTLLISDDIDTHTTVSDLILDDLKALYTVYEEEVFRFRHALITEKEKSKRLLFLFQMDLLPGMNGQIVVSKDQRDHALISKGVSRSAKLLGWITLCVIDVGMLFYVLLFALSQTTPRQNAWARSFGTWLFSEILLVSTVMVWFMNVFIPSLVMKDLSAIKEKLMDSILSFYDHLQTLQQPNQITTKHNTKYVVHKKKSEEVEVEEEKKDSADDDFSNNSSFNAAQYLFVSYRIARLYPELKVSQLITHFHTPWPKQSYQRAIDLSKEYDGRFNAIGRSISVILIFCAMKFLSIPTNIQDMIMQLVTTTTIGYTMILHIQLYQIYPVLVIIPALFVAGMIHFVIRSTRNDQEQHIQRMLGQRRTTQPKPGEGVREKEEIDSCAATVPKQRQQGYIWADEEWDDSSSTSEDDSSYPRLRSSKRHHRGMNKKINISKKPDKKSSKKQEVKKEEDKENENEEGKEHTKELKEEGTIRGAQYSNNHHHHLIHQEAEEEEEEEEEGIIFDSEEEDSFSSLESSVVGLLESPIQAPTHAVQLSVEKL